MILFASFAALISAAVLGLAFLWLRLNPPQDNLAQARRQYEGFVADLDRRLTLNQIDPELAREEKLEAARALLKVDETKALSQLHPVVGLLGACLIAALALGLYLFTGKPFADQPYAQRLAAWVQASETNPDSLEPKPMAEVLKLKAASHPKDPEFWLILGRYQVMAGDYYDAAAAFRRSVELGPDRADAWSNMGEALVLMQSKSEADTIGPEAIKAFDEALRRDPNDLTGLFYSAKALSQEGRYPLAEARLQTLMSRLGPEDSRRSTVVDTLEAIRFSQATRSQTEIQIEAMVKGLKARLKAAPEDPDGWARLLRSYRVLNNQTLEVETLAEIDRLYKDRPTLRLEILQKAEKAVGSQ
jgi:cytochrome c-type biogenesis protein CcmH